MYEDYFQLRTDPFRLSPDHRFGFAHSSYEKARAYMKYALHRAEGFVMITGTPGSGKTTLVNELLDDLSGAKVKVAMLTISQLEADDLLRMVSFAFGLSGDTASKATIIHELTAFLTNNHRRGKRALLVVDEAQDLSISAMEELRLLTNLQIDSQPLLQIFLLGQSELRELMRDPRMIQCHQRIVAASHLDTLNAEETGDYILHRLGIAGWSGNPELSTTLFPIIHKYSQGIPRAINLICSRLFLHAFAERLDKIGVRDIETVLSALQEEQLVPSDSPTHPRVTGSTFIGLRDNFPDPPEAAPIAEETSAPDPETSHTRVTDTIEETPPQTSERADLPIDTGSPSPPVSSPEAAPDTQVVTNQTVMPEKVTPPAEPEPETTAVTTAPSPFTDNTATEANGASAVAPPVTRAETREAESEPKAAREIPEVATRTSRKVDQPEDRSAAPPRPERDLEETPERDSRRLRREIQEPEVAEVAWPEQPSGAEVRHREPASSAPAKPAQSRHGKPKRRPEQKPGPGAGKMQAAPAAGATTPEQKPRKPVRQRTHFIEEPTESLPPKHSPLYWLAMLLLLFGLVGGAAAAYLLSDMALQNHGAIAQQARDIRDEVFRWLGMGTHRATEQPGARNEQPATVWTPSAPESAAAVLATPGEDTPLEKRASTAAEPDSTAPPSPAAQAGLDQETGNTNGIEGTVESALEGDRIEEDQAEMAQSQRPDQVSSAPETSSVPGVVEQEPLQVLFGFRSMELEPEFRTLLDGAVETLENNPSLGIRVVGIVENRGTAPTDVNRRVSNRRAQVVADYLKQRGISEQRVSVEEDASLLEGQQPGVRRPERAVEATLYTMTN